MLVFHAPLCLHLSISVETCMHGCRDVSYKAGLWMLPLPWVYTRGLAVSALYVYTHAHAHTHTHTHTHNTDAQKYTQKHTLTLTLTLTLIHTHAHSHTEAPLSHNDFLAELTTHVDGRINVLWCEFDRPVSMNISRPYLTLPIFLPSVFPPSLPPSAP